MSTQATEIIIPDDLKAKGWKLFSRESTSPYFAEHEEWDLSTGGFPDVNDAIEKARDMTIEAEEAGAIREEANSGTAVEANRSLLPEDLPDTNNYNKPPRGVPYYVDSEPPPFLSPTAVPASEVPFELTPPPAQPVIRIIALASVRIDGGTQPRTELSLETVDRYAEAKRDGAVFPPGVIFDDGSNLWLAAGFHRYFADKKNETTEAPFEVRQGTLRDAVLYSVGENATHGLPRSNEDKRRAVKILLEDEEWATWSDSVLAQKANVSQPFVSKLRRELSQNVLSEQPTMRRSADGVIRDTSKIGVRHEDDDQQGSLTDVVAANEAEEAQQVRTCRKCGCTDANACEGGCSWVESDLCSQCETPAADEEPETELDLASEGTPNEIVRILGRHGGVLSRMQLEEMGFTYAAILNALGEGAIAQPETGKFTLPDHKPQPPAQAPVDDESSADEPAAATSSTSTPTPKPKPSIDEILKGRKLSVSFVWIPGVKGKVQVTVNAADKPDKASRKLIDSEKVRGFADDIQQMIVEQLNGQKSPNTKATKKSAPAKKAPAKKPTKKASPAKSRPAKKKPATKKKAAKGRKR
jgi:hypothetical protein